MILVGCDLHSRTQQVAVLDTRTGELVEQELAHEGDAVERFYRALPPPLPQKLHLSVLMTVVPNRRAIFSTLFLGVQCSMAAEWCTGGLVRF